MVYDDEDRVSLARIAAAVVLCRLSVPTLVFGGGGRVVVCVCVCARALRWAGLG